MSVGDDDAHDNATLETEMQVLGRRLEDALALHTRRMMAATIYATGNNGMSLSPEEAVNRADRIISLTKEQ